MKIITLSGWGQPHDALSAIFPDATHFDYTGYQTIESALEAIANVAQDYDAVIGWSLGGQLATRSIVKEFIKPRKLVLIAVPFQFVQTEESKIGMPRDKFTRFRDNYEKNPARTLAKAWELTIMNDMKHDIVRTQLERNSQQIELKKNWLHWLDMLDGFSFKNIDLSRLPSPLLIHGTNDAVVDFSQSHEFIRSIPQVKHIVVEGAGHAPHLHDASLIQNHIREYLNV